jgi:hypothetical protein
MQLETSNFCRTAEKYFFSCKQASMPYMYVHMYIGSGSGGWVTEAYSDNFLLGIPNLKNLVHFSLKVTQIDSSLGPLL